jgi:amino acid adenylation domain-containing protein
MIVSKENSGCRCTEVMLDSGTLRRYLCQEHSDSDYSTDIPVHQLIEAQAAGVPEATAVICDGSRLSYSELNSRANGMARILRGMGVGPDSLVGLCAERSTEMIVGLLAILKSGGAYVPIDPDLPADRIAFMVHDTRPRLVLTQRQLIGKIPRDGVENALLDEFDWTFHSRDVNPDCNINSDDLCYVLYTSGSTGRPKGVQVEHAGLSNYVQWLISEFSDGHQVRSLLHTSTSFDFSFTSIYLPLVTGGELHLSPPGADTEDLIDAIQSTEFDLIRLTPTHIELIAALMGDRRVLRGPRIFLVGGEVLRRRHVEALRRIFPESVIYNHYGPTEAVIGRCYYRIGYSSASAVGPGTSEDPMPIGGPIPNTSIMIDYPGPAEAVTGVGELLIAGTGIARGYLNLTEATARSFRTADDGIRVYATGDLVRLDEHHRIVVVGRTDDQVKIHGHRVELGEIETRIRDIPGVAATAVVKIARPMDELTAFIVRASSELDPERVTDFLGGVLPPYMVPRRYIFLDDLPVTSRSKLDRVTLVRLAEEAAAEDHAVAGRRATDAPPASGAPASRNEMIRTMCHLWEEVLGVANVEPTDNFIELGGDSVSAIIVAAACRRIGFTVRNANILTADSLADIFS